MPSLKRLLSVFFALGLAAAPGRAVSADPPPAAAPGAKEGPGDPVAIIRKKDAELQKLLRDKSADPKKTERIKILINGIFDFEELGKKALGPERWKAMPADQQKRYVKAFREMVENSSVKKLDAYHSDSTSYDAPELREGRATVTSHVFSKGQESIVTYKLLVKDGAWKAWDLVIDDLSTAGNYGDQFRKILQTSDMNGLIARLEKKAGGAADGKKADNVKSQSEKAGQEAAKQAPSQAPPAKSGAAKSASPAAGGAAAPAAVSAPAKTANKP